MPTKKKMGRPRAKIDLVLAHKLSTIQCTIAEISAILDIPEGTLKARPDFTTIHKKGLEEGKMSLRRIQYKLAEKSAAMAIFLGKQYLGQRDEALIDQSVHFHLTHEYNTEPQDNPARTIRDLAGQSQQG